MCRQEAFQKCIFLHTLHISVQGNTSNLCRGSVYGNCSAPGNSNGRHYVITREG